MSICTIVKNEALYILEWIAFHKAIGVDHFYIYDNQSTDATVNILIRLERAGLVTLTAWPNSTPAVVASGLGPQVPAYNDFLKFRDQTEWVGYIDIDEFVVLKHDDNLQQWLDHYSDCAAVEKSTGEYLDHQGMQIIRRSLELIDSPDEHQSTSRQIDM